MSDISAQIIRNGDGEVFNGRVQLDDHVLACG